MRHFSSRRAVEGLPLPEELLCVGEKALRNQCPLPVSHRGFLWARVGADIFKDGHLDVSGIEGIHPAAA